MLARLNLRHNWPLLVAIGVFLLSVGLLGIQLSEDARSYAPRFGEKVAYWSRINSPLLEGVVANFICIWPNLLLLSLIVFVMQQVQAFVKNKGIGCLFLILANVLGCLTFIISIFRPDGHQLVHIQSLIASDHTYNLTLDNVQVGAGDYFYTEHFVFKCDLDGNICHVIKNVKNARGAPPTAALIIDPTTNALYLQIGDQKTLIAE